jgi:hypothetical protein
VQTPGEAAAQLEVQQLKAKIAKVRRLAPSLAPSQLRGGLPGARAHCSRPPTPPARPLPSPPRPQLSPVADFVEVSLCERRLIKAHKALATAQEGRAAGAGAAGSALLGRFALPAAYAALAAAFWSRGAVARLPPAWLGPLGWVARSWGLPPGAIGITGWLLLCHSVLAPGVRWAAAAAGVRAAQPAAAGAGGLLQRALAALRGGGGSGGGGDRLKLD